MTKKTVMYECNLTEKQVEQALQQLTKPVNGYARVEYDVTNHVVWVVNFLKYQPRSIKIFRSAWLTLNDLKASPLIERFFERYPQVKRYKEKLNA